MAIDRDEIAVIQFMLDELERRSLTVSHEFREHIVNASNCIFDLQNISKEGGDA